MINQTIQIDITTWFKSSVNIDIEGVAAEFVSRVVEDVTGALGFWNLSIRYLPKELHGTLGRLIDVRLNLLTRGILNKHPKGRDLLFTWMIEKTQGLRMPQLPFFTPRFAFAFYSSLISQYGSISAQQSLQRGNLVLLALRKQSSTLSNKGHGSYDDQIVVLNGSGIARNACIFAACTEPGAQYSQRAAHLGKGRVDSRYADVKYKKSDGIDVNKDGIKDAGRLLEGTYKYFEKQGGFLGARAFQVHTLQIVERDTNGDGLFTKTDLNRIDKTGAGTTMYIHRGGDNSVSDPNTWSAGCQTIPKNVYGDFLAALGKPSYFYYVLVNAVLS